MADEDTDLDFHKPEGKGGLIKVVAAFAVGLLAGGGAGWFGNDALGEEPETECEGEDCIDEDAAAEQALRQVFDMSPAFTLNTRDSNRYVSLDLAIETTMTEEQYNHHAARFRDQVVTLASDYTPQEFDDLDGRTRFKDELLGRLNVHLDEGIPRVERVYFKQFLVAQ